MKIKHVCDCGRAYADLAGVEACQIGNHGINPLAQRVADLERVCMAVLRDLENTGNELNATPRVSEATWYALRGVMGAKALQLDRHVVCKFCGNDCEAKRAHLHDGGWVGDECCWDERLRSTE